MPIRSSQDIKIYLQNRVSKRKIKIKIYPYPSISKLSILSGLPLNMHIGYRISTHKTKPRRYFQGKILYISGKYTFARDKF